MRLSASLKDKKMDVRLRDKYLAESKLSNNDIQDYYKSLEDDTERMTTTFEVESANSEDQQDQDSSSDS